MKNFLLNKRTIFFILLIAVIVLSNIYTNHKEEENAKFYESERQEINQAENSLPPEEELSETEEAKIYEAIIGNTYEYEDPEMVGRPVTISFLDEKEFVYYFWEEDGKGNIKKTGTSFGIYKFKDDMKTIRLSINNHGKNYSFSYNRSSIFLDDMQYKKTNRQVHDI